jgi:hypothetical protein
VLRAAWNVLKADPDWQAVRNHGTGQRLSVLQCRQLP